MKKINNINDIEIKKRHKCIFCGDFFFYKYTLRSHYEKMHKYDIERLPE